MPKDRFHDEVPPEPPEAPMIDAAPEPEETRSAARMREIRSWVAHLLCDRPDGLRLRLEVGACEVTVAGTAGTYIETVSGVGPSLSGADSTDLIEAAALLLGCADVLDAETADQPAPFDNLPTAEETH